MNATNDNKLIIQNNYKCLNIISTTNAMEVTQWPQLRFAMNATQNGGISNCTVPLKISLHMDKYSCSKTQCVS